MIIIMLLGVFMGLFNPTPLRLEITDGTTTVDLIRGPIYLENWRPATPAYKGGGTFQSSSLADGRRLVDRRFEDIADSFSLKFSSNTPDGVIYEFQELVRLLEKAADYGATDWQDTPVYLIAQGRGETNLRYSLIKAGRLPEGENPYGISFKDRLGRKRRSVWNGIDLAIQHGFWLSNIPGEGTGTAIGAIESYNDRDYGTIPEPSLLSHVYHYDDSTTTFSANFAPLALPWTILPNLSGNDDSIYFAVSGEKFDNIWFWNTSGQDGTADTVTEYWNGMSWVDVEGLLDVSSTPVNGFAFTKDSDTAGEALFFSWTISEDWNKITVNSVNSYWVRIRLNGTPNVGAVIVDNFSLYTETGVVYSSTYLPFVANKRAAANITHVWRRDDTGPAWSDNLQFSFPPYNLFPDPSGADDMLFLGIDTSLDDSGPFSSLVFNISQIATGAPTLIWEYWDGGAWATLTVEDNTSDFTILGVNSVSFAPPSDWDLFDLSSFVGGPNVTGYWVRCRISAGAFTQVPQQGSSAIYSVVWPYFEMMDDEIRGDITAVIRPKIYGQSSTTGGRPMTVVIGSRRYDRGNDFTAYLNIADEQNPSGVTVSVSAGAAFADNIRAASGRAVDVNLAVTSTLSNRVLITLNNTIADNYNGRFRMFVRCETSATNPFNVQVKVLDLITSTVKTTDPVSVIAVDPEFIDFGEVRLERVDSGVSFRILTDSPGIGDTLTLYDFVLMPTDEWAGEYYYQEEGSGLLYNGRYLDIDGLNPKKTTSFLKQTSTDVDLARYYKRQNGIPAVQSNARVRVWHLFNVLGVTWFLSRVDLSHTQRYELTRGER